MQYDEATRYLYALAPRGIQLGLSRMEQALTQRGQPERRVPNIVVAGTNGKGSVSAMLASMLRAGGYKVGLYTSPHLHRMVERFQVNGKPMAEREFSRRVGALKPWLEHRDTPPLTFFEVCTLLAFEYFRDRLCDVAVLEVGLGGRLDATNVVTPLLSVITRIARDHADKLGASLAQIAREKAGIIKPGVPVVSAVRERSAERVIRARAQKLGAPLLSIDRDYVATPGERGLDVRIPEQVVTGLTTPLSGAYQKDNLACALACTPILSRAGFLLSTRSMRAGLRRTRWPGRLELIPGDPSVLLDAAHNPDACGALVEHLRTLRPNYKRLVLLFGVLADKDYGEMLELLLPEFARWVFTTPQTARALPARVLADTWGGVAVNDPLRAYVRASRAAGKGGLLVVAGSMFVMARVRAERLGLPSDPPIAL